MESHWNIIKDLGPEPFPETVVSPVDGAEMVLVPKGPFTMGISVLNTAEVIGVKRHFEIIFSKIKVSDSQGPVGEVNQRFSLINKKYDLVPYFGDSKLTVLGPLWRPWTFNVFAGGRQVGSIKKKWSGLMKEAFTKADTFEVSIDDPKLGAAERKLIFAAAIAIDIDYFEKKNK